MVNFKISAATAAAILASVQQVSAHCRFYMPFGDYNPQKTGGIIGHFDDIAIKDHGHHQHPGQWDVAVFSDPVIPATWESPFKHIPRKYTPQGCGASLGSLFAYYVAKRPTEFSPANLEGHPDMWRHRNYHFFMAPTPAGGFNQVKYWVQNLEINLWKRMAQSTPGGWLSIRVHQVNEDGAGPFRCRFDQTGTGEHFGPWAHVLEQPPGEIAHQSRLYATNNRIHFLKVAVPKDIKCAGQYGTAKNICLMRCENYAANGPFGGCAVFQVVYPEPKIKPPPPPKPVYVDKTKPEPKPDYGDAGYNVGSGNYKEGGGYGTYKKVKRDIEAKKARRAASQADSDIDSEETSSD
ncbi:hypothetical protein TWF569_010275 [Orbilia oligospora]|uniref:Uncharacterized protein n=1 Tax=Orbilia oligospora TaxID=2813651 RepID=A0A7C8N257_ORBOL|nr:hypothetical protein TWF102_003225 [Orbilia oligospora]KAF3113962.1 hypothetical protein TWF706_009314 [Orbilia oligospora]KAF3116724.1 hypothetical protein TWF103_008482 [Orbilia oligospora]KAF3128817.1 hypothetical protein TWF703_009192 [Orbilia oligospora]KAF3134077.1 hypothetical protein TWF569_010275 [Orbilia oligospora]